MSQRDRGQGKETSTGAAEDEGEGEGNQEQGICPGEDEGLPPDRGDRRHIGKLYTSYTLCFIKVQREAQG